MDIFAHRGASAYAPENTLEAFKLAVDMGADGIELDVHKSADGAFVVIHDDKVNRTSNGKGYVKNMTLPRLKEFDFSNGQSTPARIPTLEEVYALIEPTNLRINVEIKYLDENYHSLFELEHACGMHGRVFYSSFQRNILARLRRDEPDAHIGVLYNRRFSKGWEYAQQIHANAIHPEYNLILRNPQLIKACKLHGLAVRAWTVDTPADINALITLGVDAIITNNPKLALKLAGR